MLDDKFFLPYQRAWLTDNSRIKLMEKSRQIGMSWTSAYGLVRTHCLSSCRLDSWVASRDELQARLFLDDCKKFVSIIGLASGVEFDKDGKQSSAGSISFPNSTRIWSLSSNADAQAGKRGTRLLDEFALHPDPEKLYSIAYPGITWGGSLQIISTHRGSGNFFHKLVEEARYGGNPKKISLHRITLADALEQGFLDKLKSRLPAEHEVQEMDTTDYYNYIKNSCADEESFLQEYMCQPADDSAGFVSYDCISRCCYPDDCKDWHVIVGGNNPLYLGIDIGRSRDLSVFWLLEEISGTLYTREVSVLANMPFSEQEAELHRLMRLPNLRKVSIDQSGLGRQFAERATERYGSSRIEGISFSIGTKEMLAYPLRSRMEDGLLRIPNDTEIRADIRSVRREFTNGGIMRFSASRTSDGHADRFWALALAVHSADTSMLSNGMTLIKREEQVLIW